MLLLLMADVETITVKCFLPVVVRDSLRVNASNGQRQQVRMHDSYEPEVVDNSCHHLSTFC